MAGTSCDDGEGGTRLPDFDGVDDDDHGCLALSDTDADTSAADTSTTMTTRTTAAMSTAMTTSTNSRVVLYSCTGYRPPELSSFVTQYPFAHHGVANFAWTAVVNGNGGGLFMCGGQGKVDVAGGICDPCAQLRYNTQLGEILTRVVKPGTHPGLNDSFCSHEIMASRRTSSAETKTSLWLKCQNALRKISSLTKQVSLLKRLVALLEKHDVPKLRQVLAVALRNGCSMGVVIDRIQQVIAGTYRPRGDNTDEQFDQVTLIIRLGGPKLLFALQGPLGLPSKSEWYRQHFAKIPQLVPCPSLRYLSRAIQHNLREIFGDEERPEKCMWSLLMDEIAIDSRVVHCKHFNASVGVCMECCKCSVACTDVASLRRLKEQIDSGVVHADHSEHRTAKEALVISVAPFSKKGYHARAVLIIATCKTKVEGLQQKLFEAVEDEWDMGGFAARQGPMEATYSDGDAPRRQAFVASETETLSAKDEEGRSDPLGELVETLGPLFDRAVARKRRMRAFDIKHILKRLRGILKSLTRGTVMGAKGALRLTAAGISRVLIAVGYKESDVARWLTPKDDQSVPEAVALLKAILGLKEKTLPDECLELKSQMQDLILWGDIYEGVMMPAIELKASLTDILKGMSKSAHLMFLVYRRHGTAAMTAQVYHDFQACVKDLYITVGKAQVYLAANVIQEDTIHPFQFGSDRQEQQFSGVRCLTHNRAVDMKSLPERLSADGQMRCVFERHPKWERGSRRLSESSDHINVKSTTGDRSVVGIDLQDAFEDGRAQAITASNAHGEWDGVSQADFANFEERGVTLLKPKGEHVGVTLTAADINDDREVGNDGGWDGESGSGAPASPSASPPGDDGGLLEEVLGGGDDLGSLDASSNMFVLEDGSEVHKASAYRIVFGHGTDKSNDRLKRVRGIGRAKFTLETIAERADENGSDMDPVVQTLDVVAVTAKVDGDCEALCICQMEELRYDGKVEPELSITELRASSTKIKVRLANVNADGDALWFNGSTVPLSGLDVNGSDVQPLSFSASDPAKGVCFELSELAALVQQHSPGGTGTHRFS